MLNMRASIDVESLLKIILVLVVVWIGLRVLDAFFGLLGSLLGLVTNFFGVIIIALIVLWLLDYI